MPDHPAQQAAPATDRTGAAPVLLCAAAALLLAACSEVSLRRVPPSLTGNSDIGLSPLTAEQRYEQCIDSQDSPPAPLTGVIDDPGLVNINLGAAYAVGLTGNCIAVGLIDSGLALTPHDDLPRTRVRSVLSVVPDSGLYVADDETAPESPREFTRLGLALHASFHGIAVAGIIGGTNGGVAPHSMIDSYTITFREITPSNTEAPASAPLVVLGQNDLFLASLFRHATTAVTALNMSWGFPGSFTATGSDGELIYTDTSLRRNLPETIPVLAQANRHPDRRTILVWAAGNEGRNANLSGSSPQILAGMVALLPELRGHSLAVVSVTNSGRLVPSSNRCGQALSWCLAAPGEEADVPTILVNEASGALDTSAQVELSGTSFAAPKVTGALALLKERFRRQLGNTQLVSRLLTTANKKGIYADAVIYGQGLLDIGAAITPAGASSLHLPSARLPVAGLRRTLADPVGVMAALDRAVSGRELMTLDSLGAPFWQPAGSLSGEIQPVFDSGPLSGYQWYRAKSSGRWEQRWIRPHSGAPGGGAGYLIDSRLGRGGGGRSLGLFAAAGSGAGQFTGNYVHLRRFGEPEPLALTPDAVRLSMRQSFGGGLAVPAGGKSRLSFAHFADMDQAGEGQNRLQLLEYHWHGARSALTLQGGRLHEPGSWLGLNSSASLYGGLGSRTRYLGATSAWRLPAAWLVQSAVHYSKAAAFTLSPGLLTGLSDVRSAQLQLSAARRSAFSRSDRLSLYQSVSWHSARARLQLPIGLHTLNERSGQVRYVRYDTRLNRLWRAETAAEYRRALGGGIGVRLRLSQMLYDRAVGADNSDTQLLFSLNYQL